MINAVIDYKV